MISDHTFLLRGLVIASAAALLATGCATSGSTDNNPGGGSSGAAGCDKNEKSPGVTDSEISLGATMPLSGSGAAGGIGVRDGQQAYYNMVNKQGGIQGRQIKLTVLDDQYSPAVAQKQMRQLVQQEQVFAISGGEGTPNFLGVSPYLDREGVPAIAPYAPSSDLGTMKAPHVYMSTVDYVKEFEILTQFVLDQDKANPPKNLSLVGVAGNVGDNAKEGMDKGLAGKNISVRYFPETPGTSDFTPMATQLKQENADWVFLIITNTDTGQLIQTMKRIGYSPKIITWAGMADDAYIKEFGPISQGLFMALETADLNSQDPKVQEFVQQFTAETGKTPGKFDELGWSQAQLTAEGLRRAEALTRSCLETALQSISDFETGLVPPVTWGPDDREGVDAVGIGQIEGDKLRVVSETRVVTP
jgi:ABC-type branched-subunit amino acid transport system substrate-binding protein